MKTKGALKKRFSFNANGLIKRNKEGRRHGMFNKNRKRVRNLGNSASVEGKFAQKITKMMSVSGKL
jgi:ribosomal protein L35